MPFGGGGGGDLPNHEHSPAVPLDGGPLDMNGVTSASLNQGSITFSDGVQLQELIKPAVPAGEILTFAPAATAPSWGSAGGAAMEFIAGTTLGASNNTIEVSFTAIPQNSISKVIAVLNARGTTGGTTMRINNISTNTYNTDGFIVYGGSTIISNYTGQNASSGMRSDVTGNDNMVTTQISCNTVSDTLQWYQTCSGLLGGGFNSGVNTTAGQTSIDRVRFYNTNAPGFSSGSTLFIYKVNNS